MSKKSAKLWDVLVIGAGASGMMAAVTAARRHKSVLLIERMDRAGKKLLATGNGKCNYTNAQMGAEYFHGDPAFISRILDRFSHEDCVAFFREIGIYPKQKNGYFYPNSEQAQSVLLALEHELVCAGAALATGEQLLSVRTSRQGFLCETKGASYAGRHVIFATGLAAAPKLGSDGSALAVIKGLGHRFAPILPALCGFYCEGMDFKGASGVRCDAMLTLAVEGHAAAQERGELQVTDYGLSGIPVFQISALAVRALHKKKHVRIHMDLLPALGEDELAGELVRRRGRVLAQDGIGALLCGLLNQKLIPVCIKKAGLHVHGRAAELTENELQKLMSTIKNIEVTVVRGREPEYAQVCTGGIKTSDVNPDTLESLLCPGVYFAGELLDVDGICGGYNLQWAWSTGFVAGSSIP